MMETTKTRKPVPAEPRDGEPIAQFETVDDLTASLEAQGYPSIGCAPCTSKVLPGEDPRAGRWRGWDKVECGIHTPVTPLLSAPASASDDPANDPVF